VANVMDREVESYAPFRCSEDALGDAGELKRRVAEDGYLFVRGLIPVDAVLQARSDVLDLCAEAGWLDPSRERMEGIVANGVTPSTEGQPEYMAVYKKVLRLPSFVALAQHPAVMALAGSLLDGPVLAHPRRIGRMVFPNNIGATTPPHQDHFYIRGARDTYSVWMPLGDCPEELGGLAVLSGSHRAGFVQHTVHTPGAVGGVGVDPERDFGAISREWRTGDFAAGDALLFHAFTVHKALPNLTADRLRLSTDNRYQREGDEIEPSALGSHFGL